MGLPITFLTDYGVADDFAGVCRAVIARIAPDTQVIDISHGIGRHDVRQAAAILADSLPYAPVGVHLAIVDPGVGGPRRAVAVRTEGEAHAQQKGNGRPAPDAASQHERVEQPARESEPTYAVPVTERPVAPPEIKVESETKDDSAPPRRGWWQR